MTMVEQQYMSQGLSRSDGLPGISNLSNDCPSSTPESTLTISAYPELTPYSAVSSFNLPTQCDSNLLTPTSGAGSPPLHHTRKLVHQYPPPPSTPGIQQLTPPGSSKMYHQQWTLFEMNGSPSQASSPMASQHPVAQQEYLDHYMDERRTPAPPEPYMGAFGVSDNPESHPLNPSAGSAYYVNVPQVEHHHPMLIREHHLPMPLPSRSISTTPLLGEPHPSQFRPLRRASAEEHNIRAAQREDSRSVTGSPRGRRLSTATGRVSKRKSTKSKLSARNAALDDPSRDHRNCLGEEVPPTLKSSCPDEERCIFESRWEHRHQKGQDMWESIKADYEIKFNKRPGKEMLQMKFKRGRAKFIDWLPQDLKILQRAWQETERERYEIIHRKFLEMGGSRNMRSSASDVEIKVVNDLRLESNMFMDSDQTIRKRIKTTTATKKRTKAGRAQDCAIPLSDEMMSVGSHNAHEDEVINQVYGRRQSIQWDDDSSGTNEVMDIPMWEAGALSHRDERATNQAFQQMVRIASPGNQPVYRRRRS